MKKFFLLILATALVAVPIGSAMALWEAQKSTEGKVEVIENNSLSISPQAPSEQASPSSKMDFVVNDRTQFIQVASLEGLKQGDAVEIKYEEKDGRNFATRIAKIENKTR